MDKTLMLTFIINITANIFASGEIITIISPTGTINDTKIVIQGSTSLPYGAVNIYLNTTLVGQITADASGNWAFTAFNIQTGSYTINAQLIGSSFSILAQTSVAVTVTNPPNIIITYPLVSSTVATILPAQITGIASNASSSVRVTIDSSVIGIVTTDSNGLWSSNFSSLLNGSHTLLAELLDINSDVIASTTNIFTSSNPLTLPGASQLIIIHGTVPTSGSGSGTGFTYSASGTTLTITFDTPFSSAPVAIATAQESSGTPTTSILSISSSSISIQFSTGTTSVQFVALKII